MAFFIEFFRQDSTILTTAASGLLNFNPNEVLQVWVLPDVLHQPLVAAFLPPLDQQRYQRRPRGMRRISVIYKPRRVPFFCRFPRRQRCQLHTIVFRI